MSFRVKLRKDGTRGRRVCETILAKEWSGSLSCLEAITLVPKKKDLSLPECILLSQCEYMSDQSLQGMKALSHSRQVLSSVVMESLTMWSLFISPTSSTPSFIQLLEDPDLTFYTFSCHGNRVLAVLHSRRWLRCPEEIW